MENNFDFIDKYFDGELTKEQEIYLFASLSENEEAREYFKQMNLFKHEIHKSIDKYPEELDAKIISDILKKSDSNKLRLSGSLPNLFIYASTIILIILSILFYSSNQNYNKKLETSFYQINKQSKMINILLHSLPQSTVESKIENEIIVTSKT